MRPRRRLSALAISALLAFSALPLFAAPVAATPVGDEAAFRLAWATDADTLITLTANITFACVPDTSPLRNSTSPIVVDGAGFTLANAAPCTDDALEQLGTGLVTLRNLTLTGNAASGDALYTNGAAVIEGSTITGHDADGIDAQGNNVTVSGSTVSGNGENGVEAGDDVAVSDVAVSASTISGNGDNGIEATGNVTVTGGSGISANGEDNICGDGIQADGDVSVTSATISDNADTGIFADGTITVTNSDVSGNGAGGECDPDGIHSSSSDAFVTNSTVSDNRGAGVWTDGDATVTDSTVSDNGIEGADGIDAGGDVSVTRSTISDNGDEGNGNGITGGAAVTVIDSTITANAEFGVDAVTAIVTNSTITDNPSVGIVASNSITATHATISGNGVNLENQLLTTIHLFGTVLVDAVDDNCLGTVDNQGFNFIDDASCGLIAANLTPHLLGALASNSGPTRTRLPANGSPLIDLIPSAQCRVTADQRGSSRPQGVGCDIGSVEVVQPPPASITDVSVTEGNAGTTVNATFTVTLSWAPATQVTMSYATANGTAIAPADYQAKSGTVTFVPGDVSETITIAVVGDGLDEPNETFVVNLSAPVGATLADAQGIGTILDDDVPAPTPTAAALPDAATGGADGSAASSGWLLALGLLMGIAALSLRRSRARAPIRGR
jgi:hypothetical protein